MSKGLIVSTSSIEDEERGAILRVKRLLEELEPYDKNLFVIKFFKKGKKRKSGVQIEYFPLKLHDLPKMLIHFLKGAPLSNLLYSRKDITKRLDEFDKIIFHLSRTYQEPYPESKTSIDICESMSENFLMRYKLSNHLSWKRYFYYFESRRLEKFEKKISSIEGLQKFFITEKDQLFLKNTNCEVIPNKIYRDIVKKNDERINFYKCIFLGHVDYEPNIVSIIKTSKMLGKIDKSYELHVVGRFNLRSKQRLEKFKNIYLHGFVEFFDDIFSDALCGLSLVENTTGMQNKVLDYFTNSLPAIVSKQVQEGLPDKSPAMVLFKEELLENYLLELRKPQVRDKIIDKGYNYLLGLNS